MLLRGTSRAGVPIRHWIGVVAALILLFEVAPAGAQDIDSRLDDARQRRQELQQRLDAATERLAEIDARAGELANRRDELAGQLQALEVEISEADRRVARSVRSLYKRGGLDPVMVLLSSSEPADGLERAAVVRSLVRDDRAAGEDADAKRIVAATVAARLRDRQEDLDAALAEQRTVSAQLHDDLEEAAAVEQQLESEKRRLEEEARRKAEEERRRQQAAQRARQSASTTSTSRQAGPAPASAGGGYVCPIGRPRSYTDTWGAPRGGGRRHQGTDILAPRGTPIYAVTGGVADLRGYGSSAGYWIIFRGNDGTHYYYMHLQGYAVGDGARVSAGTVIGYNGDTGNARGTPHLHFERHPGGGAAVNPYPFVRAACG